jgi:hypothetical protein
MQRRKNGFHEKLLQKQKSKNTRGDLDLPKPSYGQSNLQKWQKSSLLNMKIFFKYFSKLYLTVVNIRLGQHKPE